MSVVILNENDKPIETTPKKPAWNKIPQEPVKIMSLEEVMSEQLAKDLHDKECSTYENFVNSKQTPFDSGDSNLAREIEAPFLDPSLVVDPAVEEQLHNDFLIAQLLQLECDKEFDQILKGRENHHNQNSKVSVSYDKFKSVHPVYDKDDKEIETFKLMNLSSDSESEDGISQITDCLLTE
jgi:hypothetical protein